MSGANCYSHTSLINAATDDLRQVLRPAVLEPGVLARLSADLRAGHACVIRDAFAPDLAERVFAALDGCTAWQVVEQFARPFQNFRHCMLLDREQLSAPLLEYEHLLGAAGTRQFMSELSGVDCLAEPEVNITYYRPGDYQWPHADAGDGRNLSFVWNLTKGWQREWGGHLYWCSPPANVVPAFNTLVLFRVTTASYHFVCPVSPLARTKRLAVSGWWKGDGAVPVHPTGTDWYRGPLAAIGDGVYRIG
jgi:Rps23 Pro-64 3,4-dihydroxylase Tpa1-like proline 4-hydroxylase